MTLIDQTVALLGSLKLADVEALSPAQRRRFADLCPHWADIAEPRPDAFPKLSILSDLRRGSRGE